MHTYRNITSSCWVWTHWSTLFLFYFKKIKIKIHMHTYRISHHRAWSGLTGGAAVDQ